VVHKHDQIARDYGVQVLADDGAEEASAPGPVLEALDLPVAPPVLRGVAIPLRQNRAPAVALLVLGLLLVIGPIAGGLFAKVAAGKQLIDEFEPHLEADALARYDADLGVLRRGAAAIEVVAAEQDVPEGRFPGVDEHRRSSEDIDGRATAMLDRIIEAEPDYRRVAGVGGFDRVPFLIVLGGIASVGGAVVLLGGSRSRGRAAAGVVALASLALVAYPLLSDLPSGTRAGERMLNTLEPIMTPAQVRQLQDDFVGLVNVVGELDTGFRSVPRSGPATADVAAMVDQWPKISSDLATLVGALNDNLDNFDDLDDLDGITRGVGVSGLAALPWALVGIGLTCSTCAIAAVPRRRKETP
jgi:hypothetical protein